MTDLCASGQTQRSAGAIMIRGDELASGSGSCPESRGCFWLIQKRSWHIICRVLMASNVDRIPMNDLPDSDHASPYQHAPDLCHSKRVRRRDLSGEPLVLGENHTHAGQSRHKFAITWHLTITPGSNHFKLVVAIKLEKRAKLSTSGRFQSCSWLWNLLFGLSLKPVQLV